MKKRTNILIPLLGLRPNLEIDHNSKNIEFSPEGKIQTRPGLTEVIWPKDPRFRLPDIDLVGGNFIGSIGKVGSGLPTEGGGPYIFRPLLPDGESGQNNTIVLDIPPDSNVGEVTIYDENGNKTIVEEVIINPSDLAFNLVLPPATRGQPYSVDLSGIVSNGIDPYTWFLGMTKPTFWGSITTDVQFGPAPGINLVPIGTVLSALQFLWWWDTYPITLWVVDSTSPNRKAKSFVGVIPVTVARPIISGKDVYNKINLGTFTAGGAVDITFAKTGGLGALKWKWLGPLPDGLAFDPAIGRLFGTTTAQSTCRTAQLWLSDLLEAENPDIYNGASLSDYAFIEWAEDVPANVPRLTLQIFEGLHCDKYVEIPATIFDLARSECIEWHFPVFGWILAPGTGTPPFTVRVNDYSFSSSDYDFKIEIHGSGSPRTVKIYQGSTLLTQFDAKSISIIVIDSLGYIATETFVPVGTDSPGDPGLYVDQDVSITDNTNVTPSPTNEGPIPPDGVYSPDKEETGNDPSPYFNSNPPIVATVGVPYSYSIRASYASTLLAVSKPTWLTFTETGPGTGTLTGTPLSGDVGNNPVVLSANGSGGTSSQGFSINVSVGGGGDPSFTSIPITTAQVGILYTYNITAFGTNLPLNFIGITVPGWLILTITGPDTAKLEGTPGMLHIGANAVQLQVEDTILNSDYQNFNITVSP